LGAILRALSLLPASKVLHRRFGLARRKAGRGRRHRLEQDPASGSYRHRPAL